MTIKKSKQNKQIAKIKATEVFTTGSSALPAVVVEQQLKLTKADIIDLAYNEKMRDVLKEVAELETKQEAIKQQVDVLLVEAVKSKLTVGGLNVKISERFRHWGEEFHWEARIEGVMSGRDASIDGTMRDFPEHRHQVEKLLEEDEKIEQQQCSLRQTLRSMEKSQSKFKHEALRRILEESTEGRELLKSIKELSIRTRTPMPENC